MEKAKILHEILKTSREYLTNEGFTEISTPKISFMPTDIDNHLFKVDYFGNESYLIQSPQFYKQAHIINGLNSVFEVARVFRAEPRVTDRHLSEFLSLDLESAEFNKLDNIISFEKDLILKITKTLSKKYDIYPIESFESVRYKDIKRLLNLTDDECFAEGFEKKVSKFVRSDAVFVTEFPADKRVFYYDDDLNISKSYDLIVKGLEITSGGVRTKYKSKIINKMKKSGIDPKRYKPYLNMFDERVPKHGGFAIGVERLMSRYLGIENVAETIPMSKKPNTLTETLKWK